MWLFVGAILFGTFIVVLYLLSPLITPKPLKLLNAHVLITGGSSGIGKAVAIEVAKQGANVTILARNLQNLSNAKSEVELAMKDKDKQKVVCISVDLSKEYSAVEKAVKQAEDIQGPVHLLVNSAGYSVSGRFEDIPVEQFKGMVDVNYLGSVYATRAVLRAMKEQEFGRIVFVSSQAGQTGLHGYTAYSASKFALRGLAESLQMELKPYNIYVCMSFPPDTDTHGFAVENLTKPKETRLLSETAGLFQPKYVAQCIINDAVKGNFQSYVGLDGYMLAALTCGMSPVISITEATQQVVTMGIFRIISLFYLDSFNRIIKKCKQEKEQREKEN